MVSLADQAIAGLRSYIQFHKHADWLAEIRSYGVLEVLDVVRSNTSNRALKEGISMLCGVVNEFEKHVHASSLNYT